MDPFTLLGLAPNADEVTIKRAYAQRLRKTRPDDDPAGFQRLNEAYQAALAQSRHKHGGTPGQRTGWSQPARVVVNVGAVTSQAAPIATPIHAASPLTPPTPVVRVAPLDAPRARAPVFDPVAFVADFRQHCKDDNAQALSRWLSKHPAFWNLPTKHAAGRLLLRALLEQPEHMSEACFAATSDFFNFEDALTGIDPMLLRRVRNRGTSEWLLHPENHVELARRIYGTKTVSGLRRIREAISRTTGPFRWWHDLPQMLFTGKKAQQIAHVLLYLCNGNLADLPSPLDKEHARFWIEAALPALSKPRLLLYLARSVAAVVVIPLLLALFGVLLGYFTQAPHYFTFAAELGGWTLVVTLCVVAAAWTFIGAKLLDQKLDRLAASRRVLRVAMFSVTPLACTAALLVAGMMDPILGLVIAIAVLFVTFLRSASKHPSRTTSAFSRLYTAGIALVAAGMLSGVGSSLFAPARLAPLMPTLTFVIAILAIWAWDWYRRGFLKPRP